jgi:NTP pyrophosphohydrolases including oxidative damage repair enzymes
MGFFEKTLTSQVVYNGRIVTVKLDTAELDNGKEVFREVVEHPGGVTVIPVDDCGNVTAVRQFRYPFKKETLEVPAGKLEYGEDPYECAVRELGEETGITAGRIVSLGSIYPSPGFSSEVLHVYLALDLTSGESHPDEDEFLNVTKVPLSEFVDMIMRDEIRDAKTVVAVLKADHYLKNR